jgi:endonuclease IV
LAESWLSELNINTNNILIHFNDNENELGHAPDIHETLTDGKIWSKYKKSLKVTKNIIAIHAILAIGYALRYI